MLSITFPIPTVFDKLNPVEKEMLDARRLAASSPTAENVKHYKAVKDKFEKLIDQLTKTDEDGMCEYYWEKYHKSRNKTERRELKQLYNGIVTGIHIRIKRKIYILIH